MYIKFVEHEYIMLHAKFHDHRTISSVGEVFLMSLSYTCMGVAAILVMLPGPFIKTCSPLQRRLHIKFGFD